LAALLVALTEMSAFQARSNPWLVWTAFVVMAVGTVVIFIAGVTTTAAMPPMRSDTERLPACSVAMRVNAQSRSSSGRERSFDTSRAVEGGARG
jgi:hypothetical protein